MSEKTVQEKINFLFKKISAITLSILLGLVFIYSAYTKLLPVIETFEFTLVDIRIANWYTAPIIARLMIGLELFTGVLLIMNYRLRKFTLILTAAALAVFIIYLTFQIVISGNTGNCGCFGEHLKMTPLEGIFKNVGMLVVAAAIYYLHDGWSTKFHRLLLAVSLSTSCVIPFIINPIDYNYTSNNQNEKINYRLDLAILYEKRDSLKVELPSIDLRTGKHVVAFLSLTCSHCRVAAKKFRLIHKRNPSLPIYFILNGDKVNYIDFINDTKADEIPSSYCLGKTFVQLASAHLPRIYYLNNSVVEKKLDYFELNQYAIEEWLIK